MLIGHKPWLYEVNHHFCKLPDNIKLGYTHGICVDLEDNVYVFNQSPAAVLMFDRKGIYQRTWGEEFQHGAHGMRLTDEGAHQCLYLTDYERHIVVKTAARWRGDVHDRGAAPEGYLYGAQRVQTDRCVCRTHR